MTAQLLKTEPPHFPALWSGNKTFEIRWDDRGFEVGDTLILVEWLAEQATGRAVRCTVSHMLKGGEYGLVEGWVILSLRDLDRFESNLFGQS